MMKSPWKFRRVLFGIFLCTGLGFSQDTTAPAMTAVYPQDRSAGAIRSPFFSITFSEPVLADSGLIRLLVLAGHAVADSFDVTRDLQGWGSRTLFFQTADTLNALTRYYLTIDPTAVTDTARNPFPGLSRPVDWQFATGADSLARQILLTAPGGLLTLVLTYDPEASAGSPCTLSARVTSDLMNGRLTFEYRPGGRRVYSGPSFDLNSADTLLPLVIPDSAVTGRGAEFRVTVDDGRDRLEAGREIRVRVSRLPAPRPLALDRYGLFSTPLARAGMSLGAVLFDDLGAHLPARWRAFEWRDPRFVELALADTLTQGRSYWLRSRVPNPWMDLDTIVSTSTAAPFPVTLAPGWNAVASPFAFSPAWSDILAATGADTALLLGPYAWDGAAWVNPLDIQVMEPWQGYYIKNRADTAVTLRVPPLETLPSLVKTTAPARGLFRISLESGGKTSDNALFGLGMASCALLEGGRVLQPEPPAPPGEPGPRGFFLKDSGDDGPGFMTDLRPSLGTGQAWRYCAEWPGPGEPVSLIFNPLEAAFPGKTGVRIYDDRRGFAFDPTASPAYRFTALSGEKKRTFLILAGEPDYLERLTGAALRAPQALSLTAGGPNPFNPRIALQYAVPARLNGGRRVELTVYDAAGRPLAALARGLHDAGRYRCAWEGRDARGRAMAGGVYLVRMEADGKAVRTLRITLLK